MPVESATWLRIKKRLLGGYLVTRFGPDLMLKQAEQELDAKQAEAQFLK